MKKLLIIICILVTPFAFAQTTINGIVKNVKNERLMGTTITAQNIVDKKIFAYAIANINGEYSLQFAKNADSLLLKVSYLGYQSQSKIIANKNGNINFVLQESTEQLREVLIKTDPVVYKKDTINYKVSALKKEDDRVIADVIKRIPGITMQQNGQILYQGKAINKFYIENLDMLEGRYNLATNNLPASQVASVQVYENHQPIKLLDSIVNTDRAALNIKLKKNFSYALPVNLSVGYKPILWDFNFTPLLFTKKQQALVSLQSNNTGKDLEKELADFSSEIQINSLTTNQLLNISDILKPDYDKRWWLDNKTHLFSFNYLTSLLKDTQIKLNADYFYDLQNEFATQKQKIILPSKNITINEVLSNNFENKVLKTTLILEKNSKKVYLKNKFLFKTAWRDANGKITNKDIFQELESPSKKYQNNFYCLVPLGKQLIGFHSEIKYSENDQLLQITPGQFVEMFNQSSDYQKSTQSVRRSKWSTKNSFGLTKKINKITVNNDVIVGYNTGNMESQIVIFNNEIPSTLPNDFKNKNRFHKTYLTNKLSVSVNSDSWRYGVVLPLRYVDINQTQEVITKTKELSRLFINPNLWIIKYLNNWKIRVSASQDHSISDISQLYQGAMQTSYNYLRRYDVPIDDKISNRAMIMLSYKDVVRGFNITLSTAYTERKNHFIQTYNYSENGSVGIIALSKNNTSYSNNISFQLAKYIFKTKTNLKLNIHYFDNNQLGNINGEFSRMYSKNLLLQPSIDFSLTKYLSIYLYAHLNYFSTRQSIKDVVSQSFQHNYSSKIFIYPKKNHRVKLYFDYYLNSYKSTSNQVFMNLEYRYKLPKKRIEFNVEWRNITQKEQYISIQNFDNILLQNTYNLRPSQVLFGVRFSL